MTSAQKKYGLMTMGLGVVFLYVFMTEVTDRWRGVFQLYGEVTLKEEIVITPEHLAEEKMNLLKKKRSLTSIMANNGSMYEQSQTGVCEYLNACAKESGVRFESLVPVESSLSDIIKEIGFTITSHARYHHVGELLNKIEIGPVLVRVKKVEMSAALEGSPELAVTIEGSAYMIAGR